MTSTATRSPDRIAADNLAAEDRALAQRERDAETPAATEFRVTQTAGLIALAVNVAHPGRSSAGEVTATEYDQATFVFTDEVTGHTYRVTVDDAPEEA